MMEGDIRPPSRQLLPSKKLDIPTYSESSRLGTTSIPFPFPSIRARAGDRESAEIQGVHIQFPNHLQAFRFINPLPQSARETQGFIHFDLVISSMTTFVIRTPTFINAQDLPDEMPIPFFHT
jgi:hypothetical protein